MMMPASLAGFMFKVLALVTMAAGLRIRSKRPPVLPELDPRYSLAPPRNPHAKEVIYVIGDTHGNEKFLLQSLLATGKFHTHPTEGLRWDERELVQSAEGLYTIYIVGDMIDRNPDDRTMLFLIQKLSAESPSKFGRLVVLLGNHEMMTLQGFMHYAQSSAYSKSQVTDKTWRSFQRKGGLIGDDGYAEDKGLVEWLQGLDVIVRHGGVLISHAGLSKDTLDLFLSTHMERTGVPDPNEVVKKMNKVARAYMKEKSECFTEKRSLSECNDIPVPALLSADGDGLSTKAGIESNAREAGILWYRGYAREPMGAGTEDACEEQKAVGGKMDVQAMVNAHTTHNYIYRFCHRRDVPCFAVDTHTQSRECIRINKDDGECENPGANPDKYELPPRSPQALRLELDGELALIADSVSTCAMLPSKESNSTLLRYCRTDWITRIRVRAGDMCCQQ